MKNFDDKYESLIKEYADAGTVTAPVKPTTQPTTTPSVRPGNPMVPRPGIQPRPKAEEQPPTEPEIQDTSTQELDQRINPDVLKFLKARGRNVPTN